MKKMIVRGVLSLVEKYSSSLCENIMIKNFLK